MYRSLLLTFAAALSLGACDSSDHTIVQGGAADPMANVLANAAPVQLPPSIQTSRTYRCKDNSIVYIEWLQQDGRPAGANIRSERSGTPTQLVTAADGNPPFRAASGYSLTGTAASSSITLEQPGKGLQSCST